MQTHDITAWDHSIKKSNYLWKIWLHKYIKQGVIEMKISLLSLEVWRTLAPGDHDYGLWKMNCLPSEWKTGRDKWHLYIFKAESAASEWHGIKD